MIIIIIIIIIIIALSKGSERSRDTGPNLTSRAALQTSNVFNP